MKVIDILGVDWIKDTQKLTLNHTELNSDGTVFSP